ncbi:hypothetical protein L7F22_001567 [Adiantum nelumboides]|nr:hypothetical protein [Adiantum nelumboides]
MNMAQLMENAEVSDDLIQGKPDEDGFKTRRKESQGKQFSAKGNVTTRLMVPPLKNKSFFGSKPFAGNRPYVENTQFRSSSFSEQRQGMQRHFIGKTIDERRALRDAKKCFNCEEGHFANECPQRNSQKKDDKSDRKGKKPKPSARLVTDLVGDQQNMGLAMAAICYHEFFPSIFRADSMGPHSYLQIGNDFQLKLFPTFRRQPREESISAENGPDHDNENPSKHSNRDTSLC